MPALPRKSVRFAHRKRAAGPVDARLARRRAAVDADAQERRARPASGRRRRRRAGRAASSRRRRARRAAASDWRCSSIRAARPRPGRARRARDRGDRCVRLVALADRGALAATARAARRPERSAPPGCCAPHARRAGARASEERFERHRVTRRQHRGNPVELGAKRGDLGEQRVAVGERDVAPHLGRPGGDAREVAKAARRIAEHVLGIGTRREFVHQREREQVRQVRHRGEDRGRATPASSVRTCAPHARHRSATRRTASAIRFGQRRQHDVAVAIQRRERRRRPRMLGAGDRMPGHETREQSHRGARAPPRSRPAWCCRHR